MNVPVLADAMPGWNVGLADTPGYDGSVRRPPKSGAAYIHVVTTATLDDLKYLPHYLRSPGSYPQVTLF